VFDRHDDNTDNYLGAEGDVYNRGTGLNWLVLQPHLRAPFSGCVVAAAGAGLVSPAPS
jgi:hypothetical protein